MLRRTTTGSPSVVVWMKVYYFLMGLLLFLALMASSPQGEVEDEHFIYPIYSNSYHLGPGFGAMHVVGTWAYIGLAISLFQAYGNTRISNWFYKHASASTIVVYIFHWVFVKIFAFWVLAPWDWLGMNAWEGIAVTMTTFVVAVTCSLGVYALLTQCPCLGRFFGL